MDRGPAYDGTASRNQGARRGAPPPLPQVASATLALPFAAA